MHNRTARNRRAASARHKRIQWLSAVGMGVSLLFLSALAVGAFAPKAKAADLGGNCCADLEERIAELEATAARKGNRKVALTVYGVVNEAYLGAWQGGDHDGRFGTNAIDPSRFGLMGTANTGAGVVGYQIEVGLSADHSDLTIRESHLWIDTAVGRLDLGHTTNAAKDIAAISVANTAVASKMLSLMPHNTTFGLPDMSWNGGRGDLVKWVSPSMLGFVASASWEANGAWSAALRWSGEALGFKAAAGAAYAYVGLGTEYVAGSASLLNVPTGLFIQGAAAMPTQGWNGALNANANDVTWQVQGGIERKLMPAGATTVFGEYGQTGGVVLLDGLGAVPAAGLKLYGAGLVQAIDAAAMDLYVSGRRYDGAGDPIYVLMGGARIRF